MNVLRDLSELRDMPINGLLRRWHDLCGDQPPSRNRDYLVKRLSYRIQELAHGGLSEKASARLEKLADATSDDGREIRIKRRQSDLPVVGTRLIREWNGEAHEVTVIEDGLEYRGRRYRSLSAVARAITGTQWNGPAFFGLRNNRRRGDGR